MATIADLEILIGADTSQAEAGLDSVNGKVNKTAGDFAAAGGVLLGIGGGITAGFMGMIGTAADFEAQISAVGSVSGATGTQLAGLEKEALRLGSSTSLSATEAAMAMEELAKAGVPLEQILNGATEDVINLANATGSDLILSTETAAAAMVQFGVSSEEAANIIAQSANASSMDVNDWALALKSAGPVAASLGVSMEDLAAGMMILADNGIRGEVAATAMRNTLLNLGSTTGPAADELARLGISAYDAEGNFRGLEAITGDMVPAWNDMSEAQRLATAEQIAGKDGAAAFMTIMNEQSKAAENNTSAFEERKKAMAGVGTAEEQARARMDNFRGALEELKGALETLVIIVGGFFLPALQKIAQVGTDVVAFFLQMPEPLQKVVAVFAALVGGTSLAVGAFLVLKGALMAMAPGFLAILGPALLVVAAIAAVGTALYVAYTQNFRGFADAINGIIDPIRTFVSYLSMIATGNQKAWQVFDQIPAPLQKAAAAMGQFIVAIKTLYGAFAQGGLEAGLKALPQFFDSIGTAAKNLGREIGKGLKAAISAVGDFAKEMGPKLLKSIVKSLDRVVDSVKDFGKDIQKRFKSAFGDIDPMDLFNQLRSRFAAGFTTLLTLVTDSMKRVLTGMTNAINSVNWSNIGSMFANGLLAIAGVIGGWAALITTSLFDAIRNIDWGSLASTWMTYIEALGNAVGDFFSGFGQTIGEAFSQIDWGVVGEALMTGLQAAFEVLSDVGSWIVSALGDIASALWDWFSNAVSSVDWGGVFDAGISALAAAGSWIVGKLGEIGSSLWSWFSDAVTGVDWGAILQSAWNVLSAAGSWLLSKLPAVANVVAELFGWFWGIVTGVDWSALFQLAIDVLKSAGSWIISKLPAVGNVVASLFSWFWGVVSGVDWGALFQLAINALKSAGEWIISKLPAVGTVIANLFSWFWGVVSGVDWAALFQLAVDVLKNVGQWIIDKIPSAGTLIANLFSWFWGVVTGVDWKAIFMLAIDGLKNFGTWVKDLVASGWGAFESWLTDVINGAIDKLNMLIEGINSLYTWTGAPSIPLIPKIGEDAEKSTKSVRELLGELQKTQNFARDSVKNALEGVFNPPATPEAVPEAIPETPTPTETPTATPSATPSSSGGGIFGQLIASAGQAKAAVQGVNTEVARTGPQMNTLASANGVAGASYTTLGTSVRTGLGPVPGLVQTLLNQSLNNTLPTFNNFRSVGSSAFSTIQSAAQTQFSAMKNAIATNTASAMSTAGSNTSTMAKNVAANALSMANDAKTHAASANRGVSAEFLAMQVAAVAKALLLKTQTMVHMLSLVSSISSAGTAIKTAMQTAMQGATAAISGHVSNWPGIISGVGGRMGSVGQAVGFAAGQGVAAGLYAALGSVRAAANAIVAEVDRAIRAKARIASPSKMTRDLAEYMGEGIVVGLHRSMNPIMNTASDMVEGIESALYPRQAFELPLATGAVLPTTRGAVMAQAAQPKQTTVYITNNYTVQVDDLEDLQEAVEFVKDLETERELFFT